MNTTKFAVQLHHAGFADLAPAWCKVGDVFATRKEADSAMATRQAQDAAKGFSESYRVVEGKTKAELLRSA